MAGHWRIRHKLVLGLGLVVAIIALLLTGTLKGLTSYQATRKTIDRKLVELDKANKVRETVAQLKAKAEGKTGSNDEITRQEEEWAKKIQEVRFHLEGYRLLLQQTVRLGRAPDGGFREDAAAKGLDDRLDKLEKAAVDARNRVYEYQNPEDGSPVLNSREVKEAQSWVVRSADDLADTIHTTLKSRCDLAKHDFRSSLAIVLSTSALGVLLMAGLLRSFYGWVFYPIRDLQEGAGRIAQGDFEHRIEVHSRDEMEELAAAFNDMTGRLREMYRDLARQVNDRSRQLVRSEQLAGVGFLAAGVAHEINNPLASIAFCSEALERRLADLLDGGRGPDAGADREVVAKYLKMIQQEAFRCKEITQRLLEFSRGGERRREPADLGEQVQAVLDMVQHLQNCKGKVLTFRPATRVVASVNAQEIKSVILNLVVNALDSMEDGGRLTVTLGQRDGMAELVLADTGCGMPAEVLENIFEPFFTRSRTGKGTGLGLSISHRIISQHGGEIEAASPGPGHGSTFTVRLPLRPADTGSGTDGRTDPPILPLHGTGTEKEEKRGNAAA